MSHRKKLELEKKTSFVVSEPRFIQPKKLSTLTKFNIFSTIKEEGDFYLDEQLSHAIYDIEIANSNALMAGKKK